MNTPFVIDSCALMNACQHYSMTSRTFSPIWETFEEMISKGQLVSSSEVLEEIKDDELSKWAKKHRKFFLPLTKEIQDETKEILKLYPELIQMRSLRNSNADPFLVATAYVIKGTVVSDEKLGDEKSRQFKIPNVCNAKGIPCIKLNDFIREIMP